MGKVNKAFVTLNEKRQRNKMQLRCGKFVEAKGVY